LDLQALAVRLLKPSQHLVEVEYFTARVRNQPESEQRQAAYLDALAAHCPLVKVVQGRFQEKTHECWSCGGRWVSYEEKETDVSIAVQLVAPGPSEVRNVQGVPTTSPERSIVDSLEAGTQPEQVGLAIRQALERGLTAPAPACGSGWPARSGAAVC
jgi:hypothetical protein